MINYLKKKKKNRGFTLIELITVVGVIMILTGIIFLMPRESIDMDLAARKMASDFRWIQNSAMVGYSPGANKVYGFGIHTEGDGSGYVLYYTENAEDKHVTYGSDSSQKIRDVKFQGGLTIGNAAGQDVDVFYIPPDPTVVITPDPASSSVYFELEYKGENATIEISKGGLIEY